MAGTQGNENLLGAVAYLVAPFTGIALLLIEKKSKFVRFHAMQSTILSIGVIALWFILMLIPILGGLILLFLPLLVFVLWLVLMWKAFNGETYKVPYIGDMAEKQLAKMG